MNDPRLVPLGTELPATTRDAERSTSGAALLLFENANGAIHASLRFARLRPMRAEFALDVVNATDEPLLATIYALADGAQEIPLAPYSIWIDRRTEAYVDLPVSWLAMVTCRAISIRLQGRSVHQRLEAAMPRPSALKWFLAGAFIVGAIAFAVGALHPRVVSLQIPSTVVAGSRFDVAYATGGVGARSWELDDLSGGRVDGGTLDAPQATLPVNAPRVGRESTYTLRVTSTGVFGSADANRPLVVTTPRPAVAPPRIISFTLDRAAVVDGGVVTVRYRVNADGGDVLAVDAQGTIWAQAPVVASGVTELALPRFERDKELQIRLVVRRGAQLASAGIGVETIAPKR